MRKVLGIFLFVLFLPLAAHAATCDAGYYLNENGTCVVCLDNHYCVGDDIMRACPEITYTKQDVIQLIRDKGLDVEYIDLMEINTAWHRSAVNNKSIEHCVMLANMAHAVQGNYIISFLYSSLTNNYTTFATIYWLYANTGYYLSRQPVWNQKIWYDVKPCTNAYPNNSHYSGPGTPDNSATNVIDANDCPWDCDTGYGRTANDTCEPLCDAGITSLKTSNGLSYNVYANKTTTPAINIKPENGGICYVNLALGQTTNAIHIKYGGTIYHATN